MLVIVGFALMIVFIFRYHYFRISDPECRKNTKDGVTYKDAFGQLRLLRDGRKVRYRKDDSGRIRLFYGDSNEWAVNPYENNKDAARFKGEPDYLCDTWGSGRKGYIHEIFATGERYIKESINGRSYYIEYGGNKPLKIIREAGIDVPGAEGVNLDLFNELLAEIYNENPSYYCDHYYTDIAYNRYQRTKRGAVQKQQLEERTSEYKRLKEKTDYLWQRHLSKETKEKLGLIGEKYELTKLNIPTKKKRVR